VDTFAGIRLSKSKRDMNIHFHRICFDHRRGGGHPSPFIRPDSGDTFPPFRRPNGWRGFTYYFGNRCMYEYARPLMSPCYHNTRQNGIYPTYIHVGNEYNCEAINTPRERVVAHVAALTKI
jgi:hypothetical protein